MIEQIQALAELERIGITFQPTSENEVRLKCPVHEDKSPSLSLNTETNLWICQASSCKAKGDIISLLSHFLKCSRNTIKDDLSTRYDLKQVKEIRPETIEKYHAEVFHAGPLLQALRDRGVTDEMLYYSRIGFWAGRITIPVRDLQSRVVNVRRYLPGAPGPEKFKNTPGYGKHQLYQIEDTQFPDIWLCGGELKALVAGFLLRPNNSGALAVSAGEGAWVSEWNQLFVGKRVYICMDADKAGVTASYKLAMRLYRTCEVFIIRLPLDLEKHPKGDLNDYIATEKATAQDLLRLQEEAEPFIPKEDAEIPDEAVEVHVSDALNQHNIGKRVRFSAVVAMKAQDPHLIPKEVSFTCSKNEKNCTSCPLYLIEGPDDDSPAKVTLSPVSQGLLSLIDTPASQQQNGIASALRVPKCRSVEFFPLSYSSVRDVRLTPILSISEQSGSDVLLPGFCVDTEIELNSPNIFEAALWPHPKDQKATLLICKAEQTADSMVNYVPRDLEDLEVFQPKEWTKASLQDKLKNIYDDLVYNVTSIRQRQDMHLVIDLTFHSVLFFKFDGRIRNGWLNSLIVGDSSQGKTEASSLLKDHYGLGIRVECKNASLAGLVGGLQQIGTRWFVSWGIIPTQDRRLVILEEVKGAPIELLGKLTDMRSSGIAEIPKIEHRKASARTRLLFISNPRSTKRVTAYPFGVSAITELIGGLEDVRRFDIAYIVSADEVSAEEINRKNTLKEAVEHKFTSSLCRRLILWGWTLSPNQIEFSDEAVDEILRISNVACEKFTEAIPLIDRGTVRLKLARLSAALAVRTFSYEKDKLRIRKCHVETVWELLDEVYSKPLFGYLDYSQAQKRSSVMGDRSKIVNFIKDLRYPSGFAENLMLQDEVVMQDIMDWEAVEKDQAHTILSFLVRNRALHRKRNSYQKTAPFIQLLKELEGKLSEENERESKYEG
jgi:hypothetical protein